MAAALMLALGCIAVPPAEHVYSTRLRAHGSLSGGPASIDSHSRDAIARGVDVLWWNDEDFRISSQRQITRFGFEAWTLPIDHGEAWTLRSDRQRGLKARRRLRPPKYHYPGGWGELETVDPREGAHSLRIYGASPRDSFHPYLYDFRGRHDLQRRALASDVTLRISVFPEELGPDALAIIELRLSEHPSPTTGELETATLQYVCAPDPGEPSREAGNYVIQIDCPAGQWSDLELPVTSDAVRGFGPFEGEDNGLVSIRFGIATRHGARASVRFDRLVIEQARDGAQTLERQQALLQTAARRYPEATQHQGLDVAYTGLRLSEFSLEPHLLDYDQLLRESDLPILEPPVTDAASFDDFVARRAVARIHQRGGLVGYDQPFATVREPGRPAEREAVLAALIDTRAFGADLLEVGYREHAGHSLADHLWLWDQLSLEGLRLVAVSGAESAGDVEEAASNDLVSWIRAHSARQRDLLASLRAGRVFFGDIAMFDGELELQTPAGARMGDTVTDAAATELVAIDISGLSEGDRIDVIEGSGRSATHEARSTRIQLEHEARPRPDGDDFVRVEVYDRDGAPKVFSNPIWFARSARDETPAERAGD